MHQPHRRHHQRAGRHAQRHGPTRMQMLGPLAEDDVARPAGGGCQGKQHPRRVQGARCSPDGQQQQQPRHGTGNPQIIDPAAGRKERHRQRPAELDGHRHPERNRPDGHVEHQVHHPQRHPVAQHHPPVLPWQPVPPGARGQQQHQRRKPQPQRRRTLRANQRKQLLGQRRAQRQCDHRGQQRQHRLQGKALRPAPVLLLILHVFSLFRRFHGTQNHRTMRPVRA